MDQNNDEELRGSVLPKTDESENNGDNSAEEILESALNTLKIVIIVGTLITCMLMVVGGIISVAMAGSFIPFFICLFLAPLTGYVGFAVANIIWAEGMLFVNISNNVREIRKIVLGKN